VSGSVISGKREVTTCAASDDAEAASSKSPNNTKVDFIADSEGIVCRRENGDSADQALAQKA
jgi:hypothetical protein